jgi:hypothetical protein
MQRRKIFFFFKPMGLSLSYKKMVSDFKNDKNHKQKLLEHTTFHIFVLYFYYVNK